MLLVSWFGARLIVASGGNPAVGMSTGQLTSMFAYAVQILMSLMMISMVLVMLTISRASAERIVELLKEESDLKNGENPVMVVKDGSIRFSNVEFSYSKEADRPCLSGVDLSFAPARPWEFWAGQARQNRRWSSSYPGFTMLRREAFSSAGWT
jgi:ATP-binding cassette subfamily B protein